MWCVVQLYEDVVEPRALQVSAQVRVRCDTLWRATNLPAASRDLLDLGDEIWEILLAGRWEPGLDVEVNTINGDRTERTLGVAVSSVAEVVPDPLCEVLGRGRAKELLVLWPRTTEGQKNLLAAGLALLKTLLDLWAPQQAAATNHTRLLGERLAARVGEVEDWLTGASLIRELRKEGHNDFIDGIVRAEIVDLNIALIGRSLVVTSVAPVCNKLVTTNNTRYNTLVAPGRCCNSRSGHETREQCACRTHLAGNKRIVLDYYYGKMSAFGGRSL